MIANFFNKTKPVVIFTVILTLFVFYLTAIVLFKFNDISIAYVAKRLLVFACFVFFILGVNFVIQKNNLTYNNSYALLFIVLMLGTFYETMFSNSVLFANFVLLLSWRKIYSLKSGTNVKQKLFDASFWVGIATLIYAWSLFYIVLIYLAIIIYQKLDFKNLWIPLIGFSTPIFIYFTYFFYTDNLAVFYERWLFEPNLNFVVYNQLKFLIPITFLLTLGIWSIVNLTPKFANRGVNSKRAWRVVLNQLLISVFILLLSPVKNGSEMFFIVFPLSLIVALFLKKSVSSNFKNLIMYLTFAIAIAVYFL
ncbi:hypothetical protein EC396_04060 [Lutibacter sp. HS1-25]|uniref:DUF6427 family protein n=1 Tax=Lutibacter sp. HS1-25 TaxID=2485000 RepID=UPI0010117950|nr:DUF6427 family protein [Lutibacter sp. HS1-25]RXP61377.1 hypothetical protein EC396_04060 [Lutibacter sp. HS1-25]